MAKGGDFLGEFGPERSAPKSSPSGGVKSAKDIPYSKPVGPTNIGDRGPGLHGNTSQCGTQGGEMSRPSEGGGSKGGGTNHGNCGSQGQH